MGWVTLVVVVGIALWTYYNMPKIPKVTERPGDIQCPVCEDGSPIPVVFGTVCIKGANVTWWGGVETTKVVGGKGEGRLVYYISMHLGLCHGRLDSILRILVGGRLLRWQPITEAGRYDIGGKNGLSLGGYETGNGFVNGYGYARMGGENVALGNTAGVASNTALLNGEPGGMGPGYYGVASFELEHCEYGMNPYLEPLAFVVQRIAKRNHASIPGYVDQWYLARSYIPHGVTGETMWTAVSGDSTGVPSGNMATWYQSNIPSSSEAWGAGQTGLMPFGDGNVAPSGLPAITDSLDYGWPAGHHLWAKTTVYTDPTDFKYLQKIYLFVYCENAAWVWIDDRYVGTTNANNDPVNGSIANFDVTDTLRAGGSHTIVLYCLDENPKDSPDSTYVYARVVTSPVVENNVDSATLNSYRDMNPAHIIRECLTDPVWGMGYLDADVDDNSFMTAADTLYHERFGISIRWDKPGSIDDFIAEILRHINGVLYCDRQTGKYKLTLVRDGYDESGLVSLDESTIERLEDVSRKATGELVNQVSVSYSSSTMGDEATVTITEPGLVQAQGAVVNVKLDFLGITTHELASRVALRELRVLSAPALSCTVIASRKAATLNPGDPFKLTWAEYGLSSTVMRVASIELGDGKNNRVRIKCIEDVFASPTHNVLAPPSEVWADPTATPVAVPDPIFVDTYQYRSTFYVAKLTDPSVHKYVDAVFCRFPEATGLLPTIFNQQYFGEWQEIRPGVWRSTVAGQSFLEAHLHGVAAFKGMRVLAAFVSQDVDIEWEGITPDLAAEDKPRTGIYVVTDPGFSWNEETRTYASTFAQLERAPDFQNGSQVANGCIVRISEGVRNSHGGSLNFAGKYARLQTAAPIVLGTTALEWELLNSFSPVRGDNLLTETQKTIYGDGIGDTFNLSATAAEPCTWFAFPTLEGTPNAQTYPAGRTRWKFLASLLSGDASATTTITCQIVKFIDIDHVTVLAEAESDPIVAGSYWNVEGVRFDEYTTHADVNDDQALSGGRLAVRYQLTTTSAEQVVVSFRYGDRMYLTRVDTPLSLAEKTFDHTPYGPVIALDGDGILTIPDLNQCSGEIRISGSEFKGIAISDAKGQGFVAGDKLSIRITTNCYVHHGETVRAGAAGLNLSTAGGLTGPDIDKPVGPRSQIVLQYDDQVAQWEVIGTPTVMDQT